MTEITRANYFDFDAISSSMLKEPTPFHYWSKYIAKTTPDEESEALRKGSALHCATLEPESFDDRFPVFVGDKRTAGAKAYYDLMEATAKANGGSVIREADMDDVRGMVASLRRDKRSASILESLSDPEYPIAFTDPVFGLLCKAKLDARSHGGKLLVELKSGRDVSDEAMSREIHNRKYNLSAAHYEEAHLVHFGERPEAFVFLMVENVAPYAVNVRTLDPDAMQRGRELRGAALSRLAECQRENEWPSYGKTIESIGLPRWA